ncbi:hypothetical protein IT882_12960 [Microbacterium schleiferi]|uniref:Uncharacterized protein n=1 Tax=Microbacterium schleiferi TaxID=69362 RepID=A0A7S8MWA4_9MICO|nr:hypothetical protein [Microbacterium schleiferi]QPE04103.1 hypothetical protein IT882_12960 [Microbacterium schleiferi]
MTTTKLARRTDPATSHRAVPAREKREAQKKAILWILQNVGPLTDQQITHEYFARHIRNGWPATQVDGVRKRRSELKKEGRVRSTGRTSGWGTGPASTIWEAAE